MSTALRPMLAKRMTGAAERLRIPLGPGIPHCASPKNYRELRQQVAADVKHLERIRNPQARRRVGELLIREAGRRVPLPRSIAAREDALLAKYPHSEQANGITAKRWKRRIPEPEGKDVAAWKTYRPDRLAMPWSDGYRNSQMSLPARRLLRAMLYLSRNQRRTDREAKA